jgi:hypothetical protein
MNALQTNKRPHPDNNQDANLKTHASISKQFTSGSAVSFALKKQSIIEEFHLENTWDLVELPPNPQGAPIIIVESIVDSVAPDPNYVNDRMDIYDQRTIDLYNSQLARIIAAHPGAENNTPAGQAVTAARRPLRMAMELARDERLARSDQVRHDYEREYNSLLNRHTKEVKDFKARQAACLGVFHKMIHEGIRSRISDLLNDNRFREAWYRLCELYSPTAGGQATIQSVIELYQRFVWRSGTIIEHIEMLNKLSAQCSSAGHILTEQTRLYNFYRSVEASPFPEYKDIIKMCRFMNLPLQDVENRFIQRFAELEVLKEVDNHIQPRVNEVSANEITSNQKKDSQQKIPRKPSDTSSQFQICEHCNKPGHEKKDCYKLRPCYFCQKTHNPLWCPSNPNRGSREKLRELLDSKSSSPTVPEVNTITQVEPTVGHAVNLTGRFQALNPRPT